MHAQRKRLIFRAHHMGMHENDLLFGRFAERHLTSFSKEQLDRFEKLLEENDNDLLLWVTGKAPVPERLDHDVMHLIRDFVAALAK